MLLLLQPIVFIAANRPVWDDLSACTIELTRSITEDSRDITVSISQHGPLRDDWTNPRQALFDQALASLLRGLGLRIRFVPFISCYIVSTDLTTKYIDTDSQSPRVALTFSYLGSSSRVYDKRAFHVITNKYADKGQISLLRLNCVYNDMFKEGGNDAGLLPPKKILQNVRTLNKLHYHEFLLDF